MGVLGKLAAFAIAAVCVAGAQQSDARRWFDQGRQLFERQEWRQAEIAVSKALEIDPRMADAEILLGLIATAESKFTNAEQHFSRAVEIRPRDYRALGYLGSTYFQQKRFTKAASAFRSVLELNPGNVTAHYNLGAIALSGGKASEALNHFEFVARGNGSDAAARIGMMESQLLLSRTEAALKTAKELQALLAADDPRLIHLAGLLAERGQVEAAIPLLEKAQKAFPGSYEVNYNLALAYFRMAKYDRAAETLEPLLASQSKAEIQDLFGTIEEKRSHPANAERAFGRAAQQEPANEDYRFDFANALLQHGKQDAAIAEFQSAVSALPRSWKLRLGLGSAYYLAGIYEGGAENLLEAVKLQPDSAPAYFLLGEAYDSWQHLQPEVQRVFADYLKRRPRNAWAYYHYGVILLGHAQSGEGEDFQAAAANFEQALRLNPTFAEPYFQLGVIAQLQGRMKASVGPLEKAIGFDPNLAGAHYRLALAYQRLGDTASANEEFRRFRAIKDQTRHQQRVLESLAGVGR